MIAQEIFVHNEQSTSLASVSKLTERATLGTPSRFTKPVSTKTMLQEAIKALSTSSRKGFSLDKVRKFILQNYLNAAHGIKQRLPFMKKFFKESLVSGDIVKVKGTGLNGSFRVPLTSPLHKNAKRNMKKIMREKAEKRLKERISKGKVATAKSKKDNVKRVFSGKM